MSSELWAKGLEDFISAKCKEAEKRAEAAFALRIQELEARICQLEQKGLPIVTTPLKPQADEQPTSPAAAANIDTLLARRATPIRDRIIMFTVPELRELCSDHDLPKTGVKTELIDRLVTANVDPVEYALIDLTREELRAACTVRKLPLSGTKIDMARRLVQSL